LYLRAALGGLDEELPRDPELRGALQVRLQSEGAESLHAELAEADPETAELVGARDAQRITRALEIIQLTGRKASELRTRGRSAELDATIVVLDREREDLETRIRLRVKAMVGGGLENEVRALLDLGLDRETPALKSVGYAETIRYQDGDLDREAWIEEIVMNTRRYAKRQRTWFRGLGGAVWSSVASGEAGADTAMRVLAELTRVK
jgi:tRNA dimethylallyltransferase